MGAVGDWAAVGSRANGAPLGTRGLKGRQE